MCKALVAGWWHRVTATTQHLHQLTECAEEGLIETCRLLHVLPSDFSLMLPCLTGILQDHLKVPVTMVLHPLQPLLLPLISCLHLYQGLNAKLTFCLFSEVFLSLLFKPTKDIVQCNVQMILYYDQSKKLYSANTVQCVTFHYGFHVLPMYLHWVHSKVMEPILVVLVLMSEQAKSSSILN